MLYNETEPIAIQFFGTFSIRRGDQTIRETDNRSKKLWKLLQYIAVNRDRRIPQEELMQLLWSDDAIGDNPTSSLKTLLHRVRNTLERLGLEEGRHLILQHAGTYFWNPNVPAVVDADDFATIAEQTKTMDMPEDKLNSALRAMALYKGHFLDGKYAGEAWADEPGDRYSTLYLYCYTTAVQILAGEERYDEIVFLSRHAIEIEPSEELYYYNLISALIEKGADEEALAAYEEVLDLFYHTYRKTPSERLRSLYRNIVRTSNSVELDVAIVREKLEEDRVRGPVFCEYDTFKLIYEQKCLTEVAPTTPNYLILLTVTSANSEDRIPQAKHLDRSLEQVKKLLSLSLSEGDVYTRYSLTQILAIAAIATEEELFALLKKIQHSFKYGSLACPVEVTYKADRI